MPLAFINYRRKDSAQAAQALYTQLQVRFGPNSIFLDVSSMQPGVAWPERLENFLKDATLLIVVIGPNWLSAHNDYYQRRIDNESDWVRREIEFALSNNIPVIPVLVDGATIPEAEALPSSIRSLVDKIVINIRHENWSRDLSELIELLVSKYEFIDNHMKIVFPARRAKALPLSTTDLNKALTLLPGWQPVESVDPHNYPNCRQELRKLYQFSTFDKAIEFMHVAVKIIKKHQHHPRWENQWKSVTVYLSTWDIGSQVSSLDIELAGELDGLYHMQKQ